MEVCVPELIEFGVHTFQSKDAGLYNILNDLKSSYQMVGIEMPYTLGDDKHEKREELREEVRAEILEEAPRFLTAEERPCLPKIV